MTVEVRNRERDARPFTTKDGSTIREYLHTERQSLAEAVLAPRQGTRPHYHPRAEEIYLLLEGGAVMEIEEQTRDVGPGDAILIPPGARHSITAGAAGVRFLCSCTPPYSDDDTYFD